MVQDQQTRKTPATGSFPPFTFITHRNFTHSDTRMHVGLLGPCYKTGHLEPFHQHRIGVKSFPPKRLDENPNRSRPRKEPITIKPPPQCMSVIAADATPIPSSIRTQAMLPLINNMPTKVPPGRHHLSTGLLFGFESMLILPSKGVHVSRIVRC